MLWHRQCLRSVLMAIMLLLAGGLGSFAQSQPPPPTPTESSQPPQAEPPRADQPTADGNPEGETGLTVIETAQTPNAAAKAAQKHKKREEEPATDWWLAGFTGAVALFTALLVICTGLLIWIAHRQGQTIRTIERAYVTMSHKTPPALEINTVTPEGKCQARINLKIKNFGGTPARVTNLLLTTKCVPSGQSLTEPPDYGDAKPVRINAFLVTRGNLIHIQPNFEFEADMTLVESRQMELWIYGYVDYVDAFRQRHRGGYARVYLPGKPANENNLVFGAESGHNYDRPRVRGEGDDWEET